MTPKQRLVLSLGLVLAVFLVGTAGFVVIEDCSLFDAAYMTTITLSTVGFREAVVLDRAGQIWTMVVITLGVAGVPLALTSVMSLAVSGDIQDMVGRRKLQAKVSKLKGHVILCGYGRMGSLTREGLRKLDVDVVVIENDPKTCEQLNDDNVLHVVGNATDEETLVSAGLHDCRALVAGLPHDADNVYITLTARGLHPDLTIIARAEQPSTTPKLKRAGASQVICPQVVGATRIANMLTRPNVVELFDVADKGIDLELDEYTVEPHSPLCDVTLREAAVREKTSATIIAIKRRDGEAIYLPGPEVRIRPHDILVMIGGAGVSTRLHALA